MGGGIWGEHQVYGPMRTPLLDLSPGYQWERQTEKCTGHTGLELRRMAGLGGPTGSQHKDGFRAPAVGEMA